MIDKNLSHPFSGTLLILCLLLGGCSQPADEDALQQALNEIVSGIEEKDKSQVLAQLSEQFQTRHGQDKQWANKLLTLHFLRQKSIGVTLIQQQTLLDPLYPDRAKSTGQVLLTGHDRWLPKEGRLLKVQAQWRKEDDAWQLYRLQWE